MEPKRGGPSAKDDVPKEEELRFCTFMRRAGDANEKGLLKKRLSGGLFGRRGGRREWWLELSDSRGRPRYIEPRVR